MMNRFAMLITIPAVIAVVTALITHTIWLYVPSVLVVTFTGLRVIFPHSRTQMIAQKKGE